MTQVRILYALGVLCACACLALSPLPFLGFLPAAAGLVWAAYDLTEVESDEPPTATRHGRRR